MKKGSLLAYTRKYHSPLPKQEAIARVQDALEADRAMRITPIQATENELSFGVKNAILLEKNSSLPDVCIHFSRTAAGTEAETVCSLKRVTRVLFTVFTVLLAALEILLLCWYFRRSLDFGVVLLIPVIMIAFSILLLFFGLRLSSRDTLYVIRTALQPETGSE